MTLQGGQTLRKHLIDLADAVGNPSLDSDGLASIPENPYELDKLKRAYNEGLRLLAMSKPSGWYCLRPVIDVDLTTVTTDPAVIDGDISRYRLPLNVTGQPVGEWTWVRPDGNLVGTAQSKSWGEVTNHLNFQRGGGLPQMVAMMPLHEHDTEGMPRVAWQIRVSPRPNQSYTLSAPFNVAVTDITDLEDRHPFGTALDAAVLAAAKWAFVRNDSTDVRRDMWRTDFFGDDGTGERAGLLYQAKRIDDEAAPQQVASLLDGVGGREYFQMTPPVSYVNGFTVRT